MKHFKHQIHVAVVLYSIFYLLTSISYAGDYGGGSGTTDDPYLVYTAGQLNTIGLNQEDWDKHFKLMADIDLQAFADSSFHLIGTQEHPFQGVFDGNGHTLSNFSYAVAGYEHLVLDGYVESFGLFRCLEGPEAVIKNLGLANPDLRPAPTLLVRLWDVGALVGTVESGSIINCHVEEGRVAGERRVGGLVGSSSGTISNCSSTCTVQAAEERLRAHMSRTPENYECMGGLVGYNDGEVSLCHARAEVSGDREIGGLVGLTYGMISDSWSSGDVSGRDRSIGGLVGLNEGVISRCYASGRVSGQYNIGGLVGACDELGSIENCHATGHVNPKNQKAGGLVGAHFGEISQCYANATVSVKTWGGGGLVGHNGGTIDASRAHGDVSGGHSLGALVGTNWQWRKMVWGYPMEYNGIITDCYATGRTVVAEGSGGGLVGSNEGGTILRCLAVGQVTGAGEIGGLVGIENTEYLSDVDQSFWAIETTGLNRSAKGIGLSSDQIQDLNTYLDAGWDFITETSNGVEDIWRMDSDTDAHPRLAWESEPEPFLIADLDEDPGWATEGPWQYGMPAGLGGIEHGNADPKDAYTGIHVYGVNLAGDYGVNEPDWGPFFLTAGPFDCRAYSNVELQFARWLNTDQADFVRVSVEVSNDGHTWQTVWEHTDTETDLTDDVWRLVSYDISLTGDHQQTVYIRWGHEIISSDPWAYSGWNIDDVKLIGAKWLGE